MSKGKAKTVETRQDTSPWAGQQPYLSDLFQRAQGLYNTNPTGTSPQTIQTQNAIYNRAMTGSPLVDAAKAETMKTIQGGYADPYARGAMDDAMGLARAKINQQFQGDNFGSSAHQEWLGRGITAAALPFASQAYENERNRQMAATAAAPGLAGTELSDLGQGLQVSRMQDIAPWEALQRYQGAVGGNYGGTTVGQQPVYGPDNGATAAGLGLAGYGLFAGGGLGGLGAAAPFLALSDVRTKDNIKRIGTHDSGAGIYRFTYKGSDVPQIGVMAQEIEKVDPAAVHELWGIKHVDVSRL